MKNESTTKLKQLRMERNGFNAPMVIDEMSNMFLGSLIQPDLLNLNTQSQITVGYPFLSTSHRESINGFELTNHGGITNTETSISTRTPLGNTDFQENFMGCGTILSTTSLANPLATKSGLHENLNGYQVDDLRTLVSNNCGDTSNSSLTTSMNCGYGIHRDMEFFPYTEDADMNGQLNPRWDFNGILSAHEFAEKSSLSITSNFYGYNIPSNELSLTLSTQRPSIANSQNIPDQCSEITCSGITHDSVHDFRLGSKQNSSNSKDLSLGFGSYRPVQLLDILSGSKYFHVVQKILVEIAHYSLGNLVSQIGIDQKVLFSSNCTAELEISGNRFDRFPYSTEETRSESQIASTSQKETTETKNSRLLSLLQMVDNRYSQCLDEIHTVVSAFHAATELDPQLHARFALQTVSFLYKNLRERIANQILKNRECLRSVCFNEEKSSESSFLQKRWALQQLKRKDHQSWRPQRGLPEKSVTVLRAWLFQNFLHPYPRDTEKHLLAIRSGLTWSQVSNWFINARVRLWKPMIEEMYSEMNSRKGKQTENMINGVMVEAT